MVMLNLKRYLSPANEIFADAQDDKCEKSI